jgi:hypothetical protein
MRLQTRSMLPLLLVTVLLCTGLVTAQAQAQAQGGPDAKKPEAQVTTWAGRLVDADCRAAKPTESCDAFAGTVNFGLVTSTKDYYKLDGKGNDLAKDIMKDYKKTGAIQASVTGKLDGDTLIVETLSIAE